MTPLPHYAGDQVAGADEADLAATAREERHQAWLTALWPLPRIFGLYKENATVGTLLVAAYLVIKGYVIARGDLSTALGILQYSGVASVVAAGLLSSLPILTALMLGLAVYRLAKATVRRLHGTSSTEYQPGVRGPMYTVLAGAFVLTAFFTQVPYMLAAIFLGAVAGSLEIWQPSWTRVVRILVAGFATYGLIAMLYTAWLPHEIITLRPSASVPAPRRHVGYVLADDPGGWLTMLASGSHTIVHFRDAAVESVVVCERRSTGLLAGLFYSSTLWKAAAPLLADIQLAHFAAGTVPVCPP